MLTKIDLSAILPGDPPRPFLVNSFFMRQSPSLSANACSWLPNVVRSSFLPSLPAAGRPWSLTLPSLLGGRSRQCHL